MKRFLLVIFSITTAAFLFSGCATGKPKTDGVTTLPQNHSEAPPPETPATPTPDTGVAVTPPVDNGTLIPIDKLPKKKGYPYAIKTKWPGLVKSPYAQDKTLVDVSALSSGSPARCPHTGKIFIVP